MPGRAPTGRWSSPGISGQATNFEYTGRGTARTLCLLPDGSVLSARAAAKVRALDKGHGYVERQLGAQGAELRRPDQLGAEWLARALRQVGARSLRHPGNHRYVTGQVDPNLGLNDYST